MIERSGAKIGGVASKAVHHLNQRDERSTTGSIWLHIDLGLDAFRTSSRTGRVKHD
ncbi:MAG: hypothetical protein JW384_00871 [Nitrosomonadaceae bacterium]|nr:hypothetical protein [Nitrosomonadaceae bacterium]